MAAKCLRELVVAAEKRTDPATWALSGGHEAEDFLECIENGRWHPLLRLWNERKATVAANRPAPTMRDLIARRFIIILCAALERTGLRKGEARKFAAEAVAVQGNAFPDLLSAETIHRWQRNQPPLTAVDERWITTASAPLVCSARAAMDRSEAGEETQLPPRHAASRRARSAALSTRVRYPYTGSDALSDDCEVLEIILPAEFKTVELE